MDSDVKKVYKDIKDKYKVELKILGNVLNIIVSLFIMYVSARLVVGILMYVFSVSLLGGVLVLIIALVYATVLSYFTFNIGKK